MRKLTFLFLLVLFITPALAQTPVDKLLPDERNTVMIFNKISPLVVNVHRLRRFMTDSLDIYAIPSGMGSGFIWDNKGHIVTNFHVIRKATDIMVSFGKTRKLHAKLVGVAPRRDIAAIKVRNPQMLPLVNGFTQFPVANSDKVHVGQKTIAIGNPFGFSRTITTGIVSAKGRRVPTAGNVKIHNMIQTDASVNPGNSGGPLLNSQGELIGMNTSIVSRSGRATGIGFAVPSNLIKSTVEQIIATGRVVQSGIGIAILPDSIALQLGVKGVIVAKVQKGSPAARVGIRGSWRDLDGRLRLGDVITAIDGKSITKYDELYQTMNRKKPGDMVQLTLIRGRNLVNVNVQVIDLGR